MVLFVSGCDRNLTYEGVSENWQIRYAITQNDKEVLAQNVEMKYIGNNKPINATLKMEFPDTSCQYEFSLSDANSAEATGCLKEPRVDRKDDSFNVLLSWDDQEDIIKLDKK